MRTHEYWSPLCRAGLVTALAACSPPQHEPAKMARASLNYQPQLEATSCWTAFPADISAACGYVTVPQNRHNALTTNNSVRIAVVVLRDPRGARPGQPATFLLGGGPGQNVIGMFARMLSDHGNLVRNGYPAEKYPGHLSDMREFRGVIDLMLADLRKRDLVIFDQRGAGFSQPVLRCAGESWAACRRRLTAAGIDLSAFSTIENAADVEDLRRALHYPRIDLQAGSYGTRLAFEVMRRYPEDVRAVVLDGVAPPQIDWGVEMARRYDAALGVLFQHCDADSACFAAFPSLRSAFYELVERLEKQPVGVTVGGHRRPVTGDDLRGIVWNSLYDKQRIRFMPAMIAELRAGKTGVLAKILESFAQAGDTIAWGMHYAMECPERWAFARPDDVIDAATGLPDGIRRNVIHEFTGPFDVCRVWALPRSPASVHEPLRSNIPTLLLSGEFDPGTPPAFAQVAAASLPRHYRFVFPNEGHTDGFFSVCHASIVSAFLDDPSHPPDASCIRRMEGSPFVL